MDFPVVPTFVGFALGTAILPTPWRARVATLLAVLTGALALQATLDRSPEYLAAGWWPWEVWRVASVGPLWPAGQREQLNVVLLLPLTYFATLVLRTPAAVAAGGALLSWVIEYVQAAVGIGTAQLSDLVHNSAGAVLGATAAAVLLSAVDRGFRRRSPVTGDEPT